MKLALSYLFALSCLTALIGCGHSKPPSYVQEVADARVAGLPVSGQDLQADSPPPEQDAAPLYTKLTKLLQTHPLSKEEQRAAFQWKQPSKEEWDKKRQSIKQHADVLSLLHRAASRPKCVFVRDWSWPNITPLPELNAMTQATYLLEAESLLLVKDGKPLEAVRNQALGFQVARHAAAENLMLANDVADSVDSITLAGMAKILYWAGEDIAVAEAVRTELEKSWTPHSVAFALRSEIASHIVTIELLRQKGPASWDAFFR